MAVLRSDVDECVHAFNLLYSAETSTRPTKPAPLSLRKYRTVDGFFEEAVSNLALTENPVRTEAVLRAILKSDHPTIIDELKRLVMMGKLCLDVEDPYLAEADAHIAQVDKDNKDRTIAHNNEMNWFEQKNAQIEERIKGSRDMSVAAWNVFIEKLEESTNGDKRKKRPYWTQNALDALHFHWSTLTYDVPKFPKAGHTSLKQFELTDQDANKLYLVRDIIAQLDVDHREFIKLAEETIFEKLAKSATYKSQMDRLQKRAKWVRDYEYESYQYFNEMGYDKFGSYHNPYRSDYNSTTNEDRIVSALKEIEAEIRAQAVRTLQHRRQDKIDGFDVTYTTKYDCGITPNWN